MNFDLKGCQVIIDTDVGSDDAIAINALLKMHDRNFINILGITLVGGNIDIPESKKSIQVILRNRKEIPVFSGESRKIALDSGFHGPDGLFNYTKGMNIAVDSYGELEASEFMRRELERADNIVIIAMGPCSNLVKLGRDINKAKFVMMMGGNIDIPGNIVPHLEFNAYCDPKAFSEVINNLDHLRLILFPLDITSKLHFSVSEKIADDLYEHCLKELVIQCQRHNETDGKHVLLHDFLLSAFIENPEIFRTEQHQIESSNIGIISKVERQETSNKKETIIVTECREMKKLQAMLDALLATEKIVTVDQYNIPIISLNSPHLDLEVGHALRDVGFFALVDHGIPKELFAESYNILENFFNLPPEKKMVYYDSESRGQRGFTPFGKEHAKNSDAIDLKEFWQIGFNQDYNLWPTEILPEFEKVLWRQFNLLYECSLKILEACSRFIGENLCFKEGSCIQRLLYYPPLLENMPPNAIRAAAHEDINLITLLPYATQSGLELVTNNLRWMPVETPKDCIIVDSGDMIQNITNGYFKATTHRVVNPKKIQSGTLFNAFLLSSKVGS